MLSCCFCLQLRLAGRGKTLEDDLQYLVTHMTNKVDKLQLRWVGIKAF